MITYGQVVFTTAGLNALTAAIGNQQTIRFTKAAASSHTYDASDISALTALADIEQEADIATASVQSGQVTLRCTLTNKDVATAYNIKAVGLYAMIGSTTYLIGVSLPSETDVMPAYDGLSLAGITYSFVIAVEDIGTTTIQVNDSAYVSAQEMQQAITDACEDAVDEAVSDAATAAAGIYATKAEALQDAQDALAAAETDAASKYLPITGGTMTGDLHLSGRNVVIDTHGRGVHWTFADGTIKLLSSSNGSTFNLVSQLLNGDSWFKNFIKLNSPFTSSASIGLLADAITLTSTVADILSGMLNINASTGTISAINDGITVSQNSINLQDKVLLIKQSQGGVIKLYDADGGYTTVFHNSDNSRIRIKRYDSNGTATGQYDLPYDITMNIGNVILGLAFSGNRLTYTKANGDTGYVTIANATQGAAGLMSSTDKAKVDSMADTYLPLTGGKLTGSTGLQLKASNGGSTAGLVPFYTDNSNLTDINYGVKLQGDISDTSDQYCRVNLAADTVRHWWHLSPHSDGHTFLGHPNRRWGQIYSTNSTISTSDRSVKNDIDVLSEKYLQLFSLLIPVSFKFVDGTSGRTHVGFIAQDVEEAMERVGLTDLDFAGFCKDWDAENNRYVYALRYEEFIPINTAVIQDLQIRYEALEARLAAIESRLEEA